MAKLVHTHKGTVVREYPLADGPLRIGRNLENEIQVDDDTVSGDHAELAVKPSQYFEGYQDIWVRDLGSTNGTIVNGKRVERCLLKHDDVVEVGTHCFQFVDEQAVGRPRTTRILLDGAAEG